MNILNLPSPTGGAEFGQSLGTGLGLLAGGQLQQYGRNQALDYLNKAFPGHQGVYTQEQIEQARTAANPFLRPFVESAIEERNVGRQADINRISQLGDIGNAALMSVYPDATPGMQNFFRNKALELSQQNVNPIQIRNQLTNEAQKFANLASQLKFSAENYDTDIFGTLRRVSDNVAINEKDLANSLKPIVKEMQKYGADDLIRKQLAELKLRSSVIDSVLGKKLNPTVSKAIKDAKIPTSKSDYLTGAVVANNPDDVKNLIRQVYQLDPSQSLLQLRQELIDKNKMNHIQFLQGINALVEEGVIQLNEDQLKNMSELQTPDQTTSQRLQKQFTNLIKQIPWKKVIFGELGSKIIGG